MFSQADLRQISQIVRLRMYIWRDSVQNSVLHLSEPVELVGSQSTTANVSF